MINKKFFFYLVLSLLFFLKTATIFAEVYQINWNDISPIQAEWSTMATNSDGTLFMAGVNGGRLYKSTDFGDTWTETQPAGDFDKNWSTTAMNSDGTKIIAGVNGGRLYKSTDFGDTWTETQPAGDFDKNWSVTNLSKNSFMAGVNGGRLYKSTDFGDTWTETQPAGDVDKNWSTLLTNSDGTLFMAGVNGGRLYISTNSGDAWRETQPAGDVDKNWSTLVTDRDSFKFIAGVNGGRLYISSDSGNTWTETQPAGDVDKNWSTSAIAIDGGKLIAGVNGGRLYISTNIGDAWTETQPAGDFDKDWSHSIFTDNTNIFSSNRNKIFSGEISLHNPNIPNNFNVSQNYSTNEKLDNNAVYKINNTNMSPTDIFKYAHGNVQIGDKFYIGTRTTPAKLIVFNNPNDLTDYDSTSVAGISSFENMTYDSVNNRIYAAAWTNTEQNLIIYSINPDNIHDYQKVVDEPLLPDRGSPGITTDGIYVYGATYNDPPKIFKIRISDWTLVDSKPWTGGPVSVHAIAYHKYNDRAEFYLSAATGNSSLAKVNCDDLSYQEYNLGGTYLLTDDIYFRYLDERGGIIYAGSENTNLIYALDTRDMTMTSFFAPKTYGVFSSNNNLYVLGYLGYITKYTNFDYSTPLIYKTTNNDRPNELFIASSGKKFYTHWNMIGAPRGYLVEYNESSDLYTYNNTSISWEGNIDGITYDVSLSSDGVTYDQILANDSLNSNITINNLNPDTQYWIKVIAKNAELSTEPIFYNFTTAPFVADSISSIPTLTSTNTTKTSIVLNWDGNAHDYYVKSDIGDSGWITDKTYTYSDLVCGTNYTFQIKGRNNDGVHTDYLIVNKSTSDCGVIPSRKSGSSILKVNKIEPLPEIDSLIILNRVLKLKKPQMKGDDVKNLQIYLNIHNFALPIDLVTDGVFGHKTKQAVINFQMKNGLKVDGIVGPQTKALLK